MLLPLVLTLLSGTAHSQDSTEFGRTYFAGQDVYRGTPPCLSAAPSVADIEAYVAKLSGHSTVSRTVKGVNLVNQPRAAVAAFQTITRRARNLTQTYPAAATCTDVLCAASAVFGNELGPKLIYMKLKHNFNGSEYGIGGAVRFTVTEINNVLGALEDLPAHLNLGRGGIPKSIVTTNRVRRGAAADANIFDGITIYPEWRSRQTAQAWQHVHQEAKDFSQRATVVHELGHMRGFRSGGHLSRWDLIDQRCLVSVYAGNNNKESFAEAFVAYRYDAVRFAQHCPQQYAYMRDTVFKGIEYLSEASCQR